mgnify:CR=1 FL=1
MQYLRPGSQWSAMLINDGVQNSTVFKDTRLLAEQAVNASEAFLQKKQPQANDTQTYNNGVKVVPSYLLEPTPVTEANWRQVLVDSGYYKESQLK